MAVRHAGGAHGIRDEQQAIPGAAVTESEHARMDVVTVGDELQPGIGMHQAGADHAGFSVVQAAHAVEAVHQPGGPAASAAMVVSWSAAE